MREAIEKAILWLLELIGRCLLWLLYMSGFVFLWGTPVLMLCFGDGSGGETSEVCCWIWIILLYPATIGALLFTLYEYLVVKYKGGKMPNNEFTRYMTSEGTNMYFE